MPENGWQLHEEPDDDSLARLLAELGELIPPDLRERLETALAELLLAIRALIDWYLERSEVRARPPAVRDIPIL